MRSPRFLLLAGSALEVAILAQDKQNQHRPSRLDEGFAQVHMGISCGPPVAAEFDRALAFLHNFWYARAGKRFNQVLKNDSECAMAYCGAALSYNHPSGTLHRRPTKLRRGLSCREGFQGPKFRTRKTLPRSGGRPVQRCRGRKQSSSRPELPRRDGGCPRPISGR